jgi:hypothetical protein
MTAETTSMAAHGALTVTAPAAVRLNVENRRVVQSPVPEHPSRAQLVMQQGLDTVENHGLEVFVQCLYMVPGVGNALSLKDVAIDLDNRRGRSNRYMWSQVMNVQRTEDVLVRMIDLLRQGALNDWANALHRCLLNLANDPDEVRTQIIAMYGGMGSLNDLVLYKNGQPMTRENNELDSLRGELYKLCH